MIEIKKIDDTIVTPFIEALSVEQLGKVLIVYTPPIYVKFLNKNLNFEKSSYTEAVEDKVILKEKEATQDLIQFLSSKAIEPTHVTPMQKMISTLVQ